MVRTQITLTEQQLVALRSVAHGRQQSVAAVVREAVDRFITEDAQRRRIRRAVDAVTKTPGRSGNNDVGRNHDAYLEDDFRP